MGLALLAKKHLRIAVVWQEIVRSGFAATELQDMRVSAANAKRVGQMQGQWTASGIATTAAEAVAARMAWELGSPAIGSLDNLEVNQNQQLGFLHHHAIEHLQEAMMNLDLMFQAPNKTTAAKGAKKRAKKVPKPKGIHANKSKKNRGLHGKTKVTKAKKKNISKLAKKLKEKKAKKATKVAKKTKENKAKKEAKETEPKEKKTEAKKTEEKKNKKEAKETKGTEPKEKKTDAKKAKETKEAKKTEAKKGKETKEPKKKTDCTEK